MPGVNPDGSPNGVRVTNVDGTWNRQRVVVNNTYYDSGRLEDSSGTGTGISDDGFGNLTTSRINQIFDHALIMTLGQAKLTETQNVSFTATDVDDDLPGLTASNFVAWNGSDWVGRVNRDDTWNWQTSTVSSLFDNTGRLIAASGSGTSLADDGFHNWTGGDSTQEYIIQDGRSLVSKTTSRSYTAKLADGALVTDFWARITTRNATRTFSRTSRRASPRTPISRRAVSIP